MEKLHYSLSKMMNKQVLVYGLLESTNDLRSIFVGHIHFKKITKFQNFIEIFYCGMTRLRNTNLGVFIQCQYTRTILRNKNMGQSLFKKHSKYQNFDEIFCCDMTMTMSVYKNCFKREKYGTVCLRNIQNIKILMKYFVVA